MLPRPRVLIIDDDLALCSRLQALYEDNEFDAHAAHSGMGGLRTIQAFQPDIILLDVVMSPMDGWETMARLREITDAPVVFLSALSDQESKVKGLILGASDYVAKPFDFRELLARTHAILRRRPRPHGVTGFYADQGLKIDMVEQKVYVSGRPVHLSPTEFKLLAYLIRHADRAIPHMELLLSIWGPGQESRLQELRAYIYQLRRKIEPDPERPKYIRNARGVGYAFISDQNQ